jgi:hypothetical protein
MTYDEPDPEKKSWFSTRLRGDVRAARSLGFSEVVGVRAGRRVWAKRGQEQFLGEPFNGRP